MMDILIAVPLDCHPTITQGFIAFCIGFFIFWHQMLRTIDFNEQFMACNIKIDNIIAKNPLTIYWNW